MFLPHKNICTPCSQFPVYYKWPLICSTRRKYFPVLSSFMTYSWVCILEYNHGRVPLVEQEWSPFLSSSRFLVGFVLLIFLFFCVMFCRSLFVLFSFDHCVVCPFSIYVFWLPLWYPKTFLSTNDVIVKMKIGDEYVRFAPMIILKSTKMKWMKLCLFLKYQQKKDI